MAEAFSYSLTAADYALRHVRQLVGRAERGDGVAINELIRMAAAPILEFSVRRMASAAHAAAPTLDAIKAAPRCAIPSEMCELRYAAEAAQDALSAAAGRTVPSPTDSSSAPGGVPYLRLIDCEGFEDGDHLDGLA